MQFFIPYNDLNRRLPLQHICVAQFAETLSEFEFPFWRKSTYLKIRLQFTNEAFLSCPEYNNYVRSNIIWYWRPKSNCKMDEKKNYLFNSGRLSKNLVLEKNCHSSQTKKWKRKKKCEKFSKKNHWEHLISKLYLVQSVSKAPRERKKAHVNMQ